MSAPADVPVSSVSVHSDRDLDTYHGEPHLHLGHDTDGSHDAYKRTPGTLRFDVLTACDSFLRLAKDNLTTIGDPELGEVSWDAALGGDDDKTYAAMGLRRLFGRWIISAIDSAPKSWRRSRRQSSSFNFTLKNKIFDSFDNMYDLVDSLTFKLRAISPNLWPVFELT
ncbi:hypothetical protein DFH08DRAFT_950496 [Mycena albidolilacea]|uniref:Uncharacterized protein n=1 Tax=Mycena albidolilacea TaxID=1033008 RepID=A0AAD7AQL2_9AGAR|nr:hypothetical protein DFH08DRAFT_950496 [Mycena albidolilacea]